MEIIDVHDPKRVRRPPDDRRVLASSAGLVQDEFTVSRVELRLYREKIDDSLGEYSLITSFVQTDKGSVEMIYDEGYRGEDPLGRASEFLASNLGISGLVLRSIISLRQKAG